MDAPRKRHATAFLSSPREHPSVEPFVATSSEHIYFNWKPFFVLSSSSPFVSDVICYNRCTNCHYIVTHQSSPKFQYQTISQGSR